MVESVIYMNKIYTIKSNYCKISFLRIINTYIFYVIILLI